MAYEVYGPGVYGPYYNAGAPSAGVNEVQTLTIGGTPTGGTFRLSYEGRRTGNITWSATNATLLANIQAALDAITGANWIVATAGTLTAGIGTILLTFSGGDVAARAVNTIVVDTNALTGTAPTLAVAETTPGVSATYRDVQKGAVIIDVTNGQHYMKTGNAGTGTYVKTGTQT
jgi:hypothetical protein